MKHDVGSRKSEVRSPMWFNVIQSCWRQRRIL